MIVFFYYPTIIFFSFSLFSCAVLFYFFSWHLKIPRLLNCKKIKVSVFFFLLFEACTKDEENAMKYNKIYIYIHIYIKERKRERKKKKKQLYKSAPSQWTLKKKKKRYIEKNRLTIPTLGSQVCTCRNSVPSFFWGGKF